MKTGLLNHLKDLTQVVYLSDLHRVENHVILYKVLIKIIPEEYSLAEWEDAVKYILEIKEIQFDTVQNAFIYLCSHLKRF